MPSPFPGMDPYIESCRLWGDFHHQLIGRIGDAVAERLPSKYIVRAGERSYVEMVEPEGKQAHPFLPDVGVVSRPRPAGGATQAVVAEPDTDAESVRMRSFVPEEFRETFIEVFYQGEELVTCIEVLSPSNKRDGSTGWEVYLRKRQGLLLGTANLVEIDLLREGERFPMLDPWPDCPYTYLVSRRMNVPYCRVYKVYSLRPLPSLPVPLVYPDPDVKIDMQPILELCYRRGRYDVSIDYTKPCRIPLSGEETTWLQEQLKARAAPPS